VTSPELVLPPITSLTHGRIILALHLLRPAAGPASDPALPLLMLHGLGGATPASASLAVNENWSGPIYGLDFSGHGQSTCAVGGGYSAEVLMADVDAALREIGPAVLLGSGLGGYVALLTAGAAPSRVHALVITGGSGLAGGGVRPGSESIYVPTDTGTPTEGRATPDPFALVELAMDIRPPNYAASFVRQFVSVCETPQPVSVCTAARPPWLAAVVEEYGVVTAGIEEALRTYNMPSGD
jgi:pimeloyl-ACP methyl ester carboxylesterase